MVNQWFLVKWQRQDRHALRRPTVRPPSRPLRQRTWISRRCRSIDPLPGQRTDGDERMIDDWHGI